MIRLNLHSKRVYLYGGGLAVTKCVRGGGFPFKWQMKASYYVHLLCNKRWTNGIPMVGLALKDTNIIFIIFENELRNVKNKNGGRGISRFSKCRRCVGDQTY